MRKWFVTFVRLGVQTTKLYLTPLDWEEKTLKAWAAGPSLYFRGATVLSVVLA